MPKNLVVHTLSVCLVLTAISLFAGDAPYGHVVEVRTADVMLMDFGKDRYVVHLAGIAAPKEGPFAAQAREFVQQLVKGKGARMRLEGFRGKIETVARVVVDDPETIVKDVGIELVLAGLARPAPSTAYKYHELQDAEARARKEQRGMWAQTAPVRP